MHSFLRSGAIIIQLCYLLSGLASIRVSAIEFDFREPVRCFEEELHEEVLVVGEYALYASRTAIKHVLITLNSTVTDRPHFGFLAGLNVDNVVAQLEPNQNILNATDEERQQAIANYFRDREENFLRLHEESPQAVRDYKKKLIRIAHENTMDELYLGFVHQRMSLPLLVTVYDPRGKVLISRRDDCEATFTFSVKRPGVHKCCIEIVDADHKTWSLYDNRQQKVRIGELVKYTSEDGNPMKVKLDWKVGVQTAEWKSKARSENINAISEKLRELHASIRDVEQEFQHLVDLNRVLFSTSGRDEKLLSIFGMVSIAVVAALSMIQIIYLKVFLKKKKII